MHLWNEIYLDVYGDDPKIQSPPKEWEGQGQFAIQPEDI